jgi:GTP-binding protein Era
MTEAGHRCGFVAVVGRPNVGKSTLVNALVGRKVSIVTPRPQTTRQRVTGVATSPGVQLLFVDTPGLHRQRGRALNQAMNRAAVASFADADVLLMVIEAGRWTGEDDDVLERAVASGSPLVLAVNKVDRVQPRERLLPFLADIGARHDFRAIVPVSALRGTSLDRLRAVLEAAVPEGPPLFPADQVSNRDERFHAGETVREKLMLRLHEELPYGLAVEIESLEREPGGRVLLRAVVWVERESHKAIVIGKGGQLLKDAGRAARLELKARLGTPVHLEIWVKVREGWSDREGDLRRLGIED